MFIFIAQKIDILRVTAEIFCSNILIFMNKNFYPIDVSRYRFLKNVHVFFNRGKQDFYPRFPKDLAIFQEMFIFIAQKLIFYGLQQRFFVRHIKCSEITNKSLYNFLDI